ncbi:hypothetical protein Poli38472_005352 [Pythium oligandrum]|uniref:Uncharacterized protein n=1 Tax=Pythium oligandrum TaxID=41045 RepID=A0A8K1CGQ7_PYTOL|nr:hypothetical protein Poli38472_005352 [Pythium oligandrum]|eukprot:TMW62734.1 hypothetical protein Poli38472_005352 [Pythium oligandrum]
MDIQGIHESAVPWETIVVTVEIVGALAASLWMMHHRVARDMMILGGDPHTVVALSPLAQPSSYCSLGLLLAYRALATVFYVVVQLYDIYRTSWRCLAFYTSWNFIAQGSYFACAALRTRKLWKRSMDPQGEYTALRDESMSFLRTNTFVGATRRSWLRLDLVLDVCLATSLLIGVVVWTILYPYAQDIGHPELILNGVSYCQHVINIVLLQLDFVSTRHTVVLDALPFLIAWPTIYCVFTWIVHGTIKRGFWPYPFLKLDTPWAPLWYGGLLFAHLVAFLVMLYLSKVKTAYRERSLRQEDYGNDSESGLESTPEPLSPRASEPHGHF